LAADIGPGTAVNVNLERVTAAEWSRAEIALGLGFGDRTPEPLLREVELVSHVDVTGVRADRVAPDHASLEDGVRVLLHDRAILEGPRLAFVGVDHEVVGF